MEISSLPLLVKITSNCSDINFRCCHVHGLELKALICSVNCALEGFKR